MCSSQVNLPLFRLLLCPCGIISGCRRSMRRAACGMQRAHLSKSRLLPARSVFTLELRLTSGQAMGHGISDNMSRAGLLQVSWPFYILWRFYSFYCLFEECFSQGILFLCVPFEKSLFRILKQNLCKKKNLGFTLKSYV